MPSPDSVFFFSDYGLRDEFVGVVHATIRRLAPGAGIVDLTHGLRPFDVRGAGWMLARVLPHLGPGVVLGVVDPGVGGGRRGVVLQLPETGGPRWLVGPDNGLLTAAADAAGPVEAAVELGPPEPSSPPPDGDEPERWSGAVSFDGRDLFAPAVAALCLGRPLDALGPRIEPDGLVRLPPPVDERGVLDDGRRCVRTEVAWVDRFGNVEVSVVVDPALAASIPLGARVEVQAVNPNGSAPVPLRAVRTFSDLDGGELGLMADANGHLALVAREGSAAMLLDLGVGDLLELSW